MAEQTPQDKIMEIGPLKQALHAAAVKPLGCALALTADRKDAVLLIDRTAKPSHLAELLRKQGKQIIEPSTLCFGQVSFARGDERTVHFETSKAVAGGAIAHIVKLIKKAGYEGAVFDHNAGLEHEGGDEAQEEEAAETQASHQAAAAPPPSPPPPPPHAETIDAEALKHRLAGLVQHMGTVIAAQPALRDTLLKLAKDAQTALATNNVKTAASAADALESSLAAAAHAGHVSEGMAEAPHASDGPRVAFAKSSQLWRACRASVHGKMEQLKTAVIDAYAEEPSVQAAIRQHIGKLSGALEGLDDRLDDALDQALNAADDTAHASAAAHAKQVIADTIKTVASSQKLAAIDDNPFGLHVGLRETLSKTLAALVGLSKSMA